MCFWTPPFPPHQSLHSAGHMGSLPQVDPAPAVVLSPLALLVLPTVAAVAALVAVAALAPMSVSTAGSYSVAVAALA